MNENKINFFDSMKTAFAWSLVVILIMLAFLISDIVITFLAAIIFAIALDKPIDKLVKKKIPRQVAVMSIYLIFLVIISLVSYSLLPPLANEASNFALNFPIYIENFFHLSSGTSLVDPGSLNLVQSLPAFFDIIGTSSQTIFGKIFVIFGGFASFMVIFFVALFLNIQENGVRNLIFLLVPKKHLAFANAFFNKTQDSLNGWLWGKLMSSIIVAIIVYLGLILIGVPYALVFAVLAMLLNFIPFLGPVIASIIPAIVGFTISLLDGFLVLALYFIANGIIESFVLLPLLMKRTINMNPILLIFFVLIGGRLAGILGIIIAIPVAAVVSLVINEFLASKKDFLPDEN